MNETTPAPAVQAPARRTPAAQPGGPEARPADSSSSAKACWRSC